MGVAHLLLMFFALKLSPIKSSVLRKYPNPFKRPSMYPNSSKCNVKSFNCCEHLCSKTTITSSMNGRAFSVINNSDCDCMKSIKYEKIRN